MTDRPSPTVRDLGEQGLLERLLRFCPAQVVGDDAALVQVPEGRSLVVTEDVLVDGVHFSIGLASPDLHTTSPQDAGWRAAAANLSDLAAMGASPLGITVGLGIPGDLPVAWLEDMYQGMLACLAPSNTPIVGGDICRSPVLTVAIAAFGAVSPQRVIRRSAAQVGDAIVATGVHGASRAGLELLLHPARGAALSESDRQFLIHAHQRPTPRLDAIPSLAALFPDGAPFRVAGMDSSDGLADAALQLCEASQVGAVLARSRIPIPVAFNSWLSSSQAMDWALYGGEDFELVLCLPKAKAEALKTQLPELHVIGEIVAGNNVWLQSDDPTVETELLQRDRSFQHFS
ncbi:thiamine-phosphate kinase [Vacuolonema iberomarrocanum]|uniref:thiamine-phosphate kinase n=1 Tax=Vacuolonema iberomarrocanum TaxID=3454632 RepID=UPI0019DBDE18|nr:thiamine-phosphate kinase [filamentous cyanobacterium LEGE 07170]